jgi:hypothetical protein
MSATEELDKKLLIEEAKVACMTGLLICLAREQRLIYIIGDLFEIDHTLAGEIFNISPANFRQKLTRARKDLYQWMNNRCGLVNQANPSRSNCSSLSMTPSPPPTRPRCVLPMLPPVLKLYMPMIVR